MSKPNQQPDEVAEVVWRGAVDRYFASASVVEFAEQIGIALDPWQKDALLTQKKRVLLAWCRQAGKSATTAVKFLHTAVSVPECTELFYAPSLRQSAELFRKLMRNFRHVENSVTPTEIENVLRIEFDNGSRIIALPGKESTTRTYTAHNIAVDEASRIDDAIWAGVRPMLATTDGGLWLLSTPFGRGDYFARMYLAENDDTWHKSKVIAPLLPGIAEQLKDPRKPDGVCPRITQAFLESERAELSPREFLTEYYVEFLEDEFAAFSFDDIDKARTGEHVEVWKL